MLFQIGSPSIYILAEVDSKAPFYIGEYGKSSKYNVISRIKSHFGKHNTLSRVAQNIPAFKHVIPPSVCAYIKVLPEEFKCQKNRASLEAWLIYKVCHVKKIQDSRFCVTKYIAPLFDHSALAEEIIMEFQNYK